VRRASSFALAALVLAACVPPRTPTDKLVDAAYDHNVALRFGRMDVALEHVAVAARDDWAARHASWGERVRVLDLELSDMKMKTRDEAVVRIRVSWQRVDESDLRTTDVAQTWRDASGWKLDTEECAGGDDSLLERPRPAKTDPVQGKKTSANDGDAPRF
jgi:hypothetical protein